MWVQIAKIFTVISVILLSLMLARLSNSELCLNSRLIGNIYIEKDKTEKISACEMSYYIGFSEAPEWPKNLDLFIKSLDPLLKLEGKGLGSPKPVDLWIDYKTSENFDVFPNVILLSHDLLSVKNLQKAILRSWILQQPGQKSFDLYSLNLRVESLMKLIHSDDHESNLYEVYSQIKQGCVIAKDLPDLLPICTGQNKVNSGEAFSQEYYYWSLIKFQAEYLRHLFVKLPIEKKRNLLYKLTIGRSVDWTTLQPKPLEEPLKSPDHALTKLSALLEKLHSHLSIETPSMVDSFLAPRKKPLSTPIVFFCGDPNFEQVSQKKGSRVLHIENCDSKRTISFKGLVENDVDRFVRENPLMRYYLVHNPSLKIALKKHNPKNHKELSKAMGWESLKWNKNLQAFEPKAVIDGIISFRN